MVNPGVQQTAGRRPFDLAAFQAAKKTQQLKMLFPPAEGSPPPSGEREGLSLVIPSDLSVDAAVEAWVLKLTIFFMRYSVSPDWQPITVYASLPQPTPAGLEYRYAKWLSENHSDETPAEGLMSIASELYVGKVDNNPALIRLYEFDIPGTTLADQLQLLRTELARLEVEFNNFSSLCFVRRFSTLLRRDIFDANPQSWDELFDCAIRRVNDYGLTGTPMAAIPPAGTSRSAPSKGTTKGQGGTDSGKTSTASPKPGSLSNGSGNA